MFIYYFNLMVHYPAEGCGFYTKAERFHKTLNNGKHLENLDCRDICFHFSFFRDEVCTFYDLNKINYQPH